ncbi:hypothetical protein GOODEAATRI_023998 [Goodea atripinnis]|uniref:Uncharacterized protein n=1 Tax=Goodea atripinnis TaxID=208336 RepID=A0ABV0N3X9_9TELE
MLKLRVLLDNDNAERLFLPSRQSNSPERISRWPEVFIVPIFSYEVEHVLREAGIKDVAVNAEERSRTNPGAAPRANIKRPRRGEVSFFPFYPSGETRESLETRRREMVEQYKKASAERDMPLIHQHMMHTFPLQREEMITTSSPVSELKDRWPALFYET